MNKELNVRELVFQDDDSVTRATIVPGQGANVLSLRYKRKSWSNWLSWFELVDVGALTERSTSYGMPLLAPLPGRTGVNQSGEFQFDGHQYTIKPGRHGFLRDRAWEEVEIKDNWIHCRLLVDERATAAAANGFPFQFEVSYHVSLTAGAVHCRLEVENTSAGKQPQPFALGCHPYLAAIAPTQVRIPAAKYWVLDAAAERTPTGESKDVDRRFDFREWRTVARESRWDHIFTGLETEAESQTVTAATREPGTVYDGAWREEGVIERQVQLPQQDNDSDFRPMANLQLYVPPNRDAICLEPLSCPPNAVNLANNPKLGIAVPVLRDRLVFRWSCAIVWTPGAATPLAPSV